MNNRKNEVDNFFNNLNFDSERNDINIIKKTVKRKARIHTAVTFARNIALGLVFLGGVTFIGVKTNPAFAETVSHLPIIGKWISQTQENDFKAAIENDYETIVNKTVSIKGGTITIPYCIADKSNFVFAISGDFENKKTSAMVADVSITNLDNDETKSYSHECPMLGVELETLQTCEIFDWLYEEGDKWDYPNKIRLTLKLDVFCHDDDDFTESDSYTETVSFEITLKDAAEAKEYILNKYMPKIIQK